MIQIRVWCFVTVRSMRRVSVHACMCTCCAMAEQEVRLVLVQRGHVLKKEKKTVTFSPHF